MTVKFLNKWMLVLALYAPALLCSCGKESPTAAETPDVRIPLSMSFSPEAPRTKLLDQITQASADVPFRGLEYTFIVPFKTGGSPVEGSDEVWGQFMYLPNTRTGYVQDAAGGTAQSLVENLNARLYEWTYLKVGSDYALVYGQASDEGNTSLSRGTMPYKKRYGSLPVPRFSEVRTASDIVFNPENIVELSDGQPYKQWRNSFFRFINDVTKVSKGHNGTGYWFNDTTTYHNHPALREALMEFVNYGKYTVATPLEFSPRLSKLYNRLYDLADKTENSANYVQVGADRYYYVYELAKEVRKKIESSNLVTLTGSGRNVTVTFKNTAGAAGFGLPEGAYGLQFREGTREFQEELDRGSHNAQGNHDNHAAVFTTREDHYIYPPSLWYRINSPLRGSESSDVVLEYNSGNTLWQEQIVDNYTQDAVMSNTRAAVVCDPLQYGVARFVVQIRRNTASNNLPDYRGNSIRIDNGYYPLTGILVEGQHAVDFEFHPIAGSSGSYPNLSPDTYVIYDSDVFNADGSEKSWLSRSKEVAVVNGVNLSGIATTLVYESLENEPVNFALEFLNKGGDFYGFDDCLVRKGMHFYLVGSMNLEAVDQTGIAEPFTRVFTQDHTTTVMVSIASLKNAHTVLPDLRTPQLSIGLNAVIDWYATTPCNVEIK